MEVSRQFGIVYWLPVTSVEGAHPGGSAVGRPVSCSIVYVPTGKGGEVIVYSRAVIVPWPSTPARMSMSCGIP